MCALSRAEAELELQKVRGELEQLRLQAEVTIPAEVEAQVRELFAAGQAAPIAADRARARAGNADSSSRLAKAEIRAQPQMERRDAEIGRVFSGFAQKNSPTVRALRSVSLRQNHARRAHCPRAGAYAHRLDVVRT